MSRAQLTSTVEQNTGGAVAPLVAGKNGVINGAMDIWQRGTTATISATTYAADRWICFRGGYAAGMTVSRQLVNDSTNLPNIQYCARVQRDSGNTSTQGLNMQYWQETANSVNLAGKTVTFSFYARAGANYSSPSNNLIFQLNTGTGTDQNGATVAYTGVAQPINTSVVLTTTWQRFSATATLATNTNEYGVLFVNNPTGTAGANDYYEVTGVQVEIGSVSTPFSRAAGTFQGELALCQRYYVRYTGAAAYTTLTGMTYNESATRTLWMFSPFVPMRTAPSAIEVSALEVFQMTLGTAFAVTSSDIQSFSSNSVVMARFSVTSGLTIGSPASVRCSNNAAGYFAISAEL
jgi:hypothetical protein